uniref:Uncharacterized protein n=1 Tax=Rhizophora mucronata TaxID=61149 RepID=A0A2P2IPX3_RHIMU
MEDHDTIPLSGILEKAQPASSMLPTFAYMLTREFPAKISDMNPNFKS